MNKQFLSFALCSFMAAGALIAAPQAQQSPEPQASEQPHHRAVDPNQQLQHMTKRLNLSADQQQQILPILQDRTQQMEAIRNDQSLSRQDRHAKMQALREQTQDKIKAVLNPEQQKTYTDMLQRMQERQQRSER